MAVAALAQSASAQNCKRVVVEGEVHAGAGFAQKLTADLAFLLEPIASGWIVRVLDTHAPRGAHNFAEIATPPYLSVTPLAVTTDFSFRAQDAVAWNPRNFRYAQNAATFTRMTSLYEPAMRGNAAAVDALATLAAAQPEARLTILDAHFTPGANDQAAMAAAVASHLAVTPHGVEGSAPSPLGKLTWVKFRATFDLAEGAFAVRGVQTETRVCAKHPTADGAAASYLPYPGKSKR